MMQKALTGMAEMFGSFIFWQDGSYRFGFSESAVHSEH